MGDDKVNGSDAAPPAPEAPAMPPSDLPPPAPEEVVTPEVVDKIVQGYNPDCEVLDYSAKLGTKIGDNYMSIMYAVEINLRNRTSKEVERLDIMLKTMPRNKMRQEMIKDSQAFVKDANIYNEVLPRMEKFQEEQGLKGDQIFTAWPKCYATYSDGAEDYLGMEDLKVKGYRMANRHAGLDFPHATLALQKLARFHALSFAMFGGDGHKIMNTYPWLEEKMFLPLDKVQEPMKMWMAGMFANEGDIVTKEGYPDEGAAIAGLVKDELWLRMNVLLNQRRNVVINHGDCWTNNMMFLYGEAGTPTDLKFVDFQIARCCPRSIDLNYFIHSSVPVADLNSREEEYLRIYYDEFASFVERLGGVKEKDVDVDLSWDGFRKEYEDCKFFGVVMGLMLAPILSAASSDVPDMETLKEDDMTSEAVTDFMNQLMGSTKSESTKKIVNLAVKHLPRCGLLGGK